MTNTRTPIELAAALELRAKFYADSSDAKLLRGGSRIDAERMAATASYIRDAATKLREMAAALEPFLRVYEINEKISDGWADDKSARDTMAGAWPTWGDLRAASRALRGEP